MCSCPEWHCIRVCWSASSSLLILICGGGHLAFVHRPKTGLLSLPTACHAHEQPGGKPAGWYCAGCRGMMRSRGSRQRGGRGAPPQRSAPRAPAAPPAPTGREPPDWGRARPCPRPRLRAPNPSGGQRLWPRPALGPRFQSCSSKGNCCVSQAPNITFEQPLQG